jgi:hypothetical protein
MERTVTIRGANILLISGPVGNKLLIMPEISNISDGNT